MFTKVGNPEAEDNITKSYRIGKIDDDNQDEDYRQILVELDSVETKHKVLKNGKKLKDWNVGKDACLGLKAIFINIDETPLTRKENARLRKERNRLRALEENQGKQIFITKGKLKVENVVHDVFNIENQLLDV